MFDLTPGERRGALLLLALCALAALNDLTSRPEPAPPPRAIGSAGAGVAPAAELDPRPDATGKSEGAARTALSRVDLNRASVPDLDALPGIGPVLARRIVAHRAAHGPFRAVDELLAVQGIGPRLLERLRPLVGASASRTAADSAVQNAMRPPR